MKLLSACDIDCLLLHEFFNNILSHYIEKKIKLFFKLRWTIAAVSLSFLVPGKHLHIYVGVISFGPSKAG